MAGDIHEMAVQAVLTEFPLAKTKGFSEAVNSIITAGGEEPLRFYVIPDAYMVDEASKTLTVFEVEDSHPLSARKMDSYRAIYRSIDDAEWFMVVETRDRWGATTARLEMEDFNFRRTGQIARARGKRDSNGTIGERCRRATIIHSPDRGPQRHSVPTRQKPHALIATL